MVLFKLFTNSTPDFLYSTSVYFVKVLLTTPKLGETFNQNNLEISKVDRKFFILSFDSFDDSIFFYFDTSKASTNLY